jgi:DNA-binding response OmpR family regulator
MAKKIILIAKSHDIQAQLFQILSDEGFSVILCNSSDVRLHSERGRPDLIILDYQFTKMSGFSHPGTNVPIIMYTHELDVQQRIDFHYDDILFEPFSRKSLIEKTNFWLLDKG